MTLRRKKRPCSESYKVAYLGHSLSQMSRRLYNKGKQSDSHVSQKESLGPDQVERAHRP
jgi:hypothetical protein